MILTFVGNLKEMTTKNLIEVFRTNNVNSLNKNEVFVELQIRYRKGNNTISFQNWLIAMKNQ